MPRKLRAPATLNDTWEIDLAIHHLKIARKQLGKVGAKKTIARVRRALTSAYGARRHAERIIMANNSWRVPALSKREGH